ncbi:hypothetical protein GUJ93_ZPchr0002g24780 [Zizania palustris]|uniref:Uncharacterized protein n=1 Tax=Zizania palustris TaxID=103762 RepID=A0A8J5SJI4_ZIZPA|nr:hypothetical protein GUJ93_ZPchr0002g24780 [Zizania palustris]
MRTVHLLLVAIALMSLTSGTMATVVSAQGLLRLNCTSFILYPSKPCDPAICKSSCTNIHHGVGTCRKSSFGCDCEYCPPSSTNST